MTPAEMAQVLNIVADRFEESAPASVGIIRDAARMIATCSCRAPSDAPRCRGCGDPIERRARGRPRVWCDDRCRKSSGNDSMSA